MIRSKKSHDLELAYKLHQQENCFGLTENAIIPNNKDKENYKPRTLIDQTLELIDPTPNIHTLFVQFNERFFWNVLLPVEVKWSPRMTSCAGVCSFHPRNRQCVISLSAPLLKLRPRKDLVETLLHEMIHGYLFLTNNNRDRDGHGPEFCKHMDRINKAAGTKITIYHSFHDEVRLYQQHWWRCNGPCQKRAPYFGTVRRAMNRAPGPSDFWWKEHQQVCGGQFIKIKEPENFKAKSSKSTEKGNPLSRNSLNNIFTWLKKPTPPAIEEKSVSAAKNTKVLSGNKNSLHEHKNTINEINKKDAGESGSPCNCKKLNSPRTMTITKTNLSLATVSHSVFTPKNSKVVSNDQNPLNGFVKLGNNTNNVHGWGVGGPGSSNNSPKHNPRKKSATPLFSSSGVLGGTNTGQSNLLDKLYKGSQAQGLKMYTNADKNTDTDKNKQLFNEIQIKLVECPICSDFVANDDINNHVDSCLTTSKKGDQTGARITTDDYNNVIPTRAKINIDNSLFAQKRKNDHHTFPSKQAKLNNSERSAKANCPICSKSFDISGINEHLDICLVSADTEKSNSSLKLDDTNCNNEGVNNSIISSSPNFVNLKNVFPTASAQNADDIGTVSHNCLVCNAIIPPGTSLNEHLEDCIGDVFGDDSSLPAETNIVESSAEDSTILIHDEKYPCPVCMELITESTMNQHLDSCLLNT